MQVHVLYNAISNIVGSAVNLAIGYKGAMSTRGLGPYLKVAAYC